MVNYLYDLEAIEANHESFASTGVVVAVKSIERTLREFQSSIQPKKIA